MQVIGFNLTKIHGEKLPNYSKSGINNNLEFVNVEKDKIDLLKELDALKISFKYSLLYGDLEKPENTKQEDKQGEIYFEGNLILSTSSEEAKDFHKMWKKKEIPKSAVEHLYNFILRKCSTKSINIQEDLGLPSPYLKVPQIKLKPQE